MITRHLKVHTKNRLSTSFDSERLKPISNTNRLLTLSSISFENNISSFDNSCSSLKFNNINMSLKNDQS
jgi:hypothetical protein